MNIKLDLTNAGISAEKINENLVKAESIMNELREDREEYTGWVNWPIEFPAGLLNKIEIVAEKIRSICDTLVVIGIGGSYLGTAAIIDAIGGSKAGCPELVFAGNNLSGEYLSNVLDIVKNEESALCVVSKSGNTLETKLSYNVLKDALYEKYGDSASERIVAITDENRGTLREEVNAAGYENFTIPENIGGRYSAFTPAIIFPLAVAGVDIAKLIHGAADLAADDEFWKEQGLKYASARFALNNMGKDVEVFEYFEPSLRLVGEWCKQLFGESEGKEGKGLFPTSLTLSTDLHSMGQYLQEGKAIFFETIINIKSPNKDVKIDDKSFDEVNHIVQESVIAAHKKAGTPIIKIDVDDKSEYCLGQLLYFFMMTAGVTGKLMGIDPFTQPGVEVYKAEIRRLLG